MTTHRAAVLTQKGSPLTVVARPTPTPGPRDVLIRVAAVALNPIDVSQRDLGLPPPPAYPAVLGFDAAGTVVQVGAAVPAALGLAAGVRVLAFATSFYEGLAAGAAAAAAAADYGPFQEFVLAKAEGVLALPEGVSFAAGATLPTAMVTAATAWRTVDVPLEGRRTTAANEAVLVWGASSSVGALAVQAARVLGFGAVYATASAHNHAYVQATLGAHAVFDSRAADAAAAAAVAAQIAAAAARDGLRLRRAVVAVAGGLAPALAALRAARPSDANNEPLLVAHAPLLPPDHAALAGDDAVVRFVAPLLDADERAAVVHQAVHGLLRAGLAAGTIVPSPPAALVAGGLAGLDAALDTLRGGVSCTKLVVALE